MVGIIALINIFRYFLQKKKKSQKNLFTLFLKVYIFFKIMELTVGTYDLVLYNNMQS